MPKFQLPGAVLVIDEDGRSGLQLVNYFRQRDHEVFSATDPNEGIRIFTDKDVRLVFCTYCFPNFLPISGITVRAAIEEIRVSKLGCLARAAVRLNIQRAIPRFEFVIMDDYEPDTTESIVREQGVRWFLRKPVERDALESLLVEIGFFPGKKGGGNG